MSLKEEPVSISDLLLVEVCPGWTKSKVTYALGRIYPLGTVLALVVDKYEPLNLAGTAAQKKAVAVAADTVDATTVDKAAPAICRGATVALDFLVWPAGITPAQIVTATAELDARTIVVRDSL